MDDSDTPGRPAGLTTQAWASVRECHSNRLTNRSRDDTIPTVFWPYRPRVGFPSVPRWLMIVVLIVSVVVFLGVLNHFSVSPENGPPAP